MMLFFPRQLKINPARVSQVNSIIVIIIIIIIIINPAGYSPCFFTPPESERLIFVQALPTWNPPLDPALANTTAARPPAVPSAATPPPRDSTG